MKPLFRARARIQAIEENTLKVNKKKTTKTTQSDAQKRKLREEPEPRKKVIYVEDPPSDLDNVDDSRPLVISPNASPPAKRVRREESSRQAAASFLQHAREPQPRGKVIYHEDHPSDEDMADDTHRLMNSPTASPPAKRVRREESSIQAAGPVPQQPRNLHGQVRNARGTSQRPSAQDDAGPNHAGGSNHAGSSNQAGGSQFRGHQWQDPNGRDQEHYYHDVNMYDEEDYNGFTEDLHHHHRPPPHNQHLGQHPGQYMRSGFGGRGRGSRPQYRAYAHPYESAGYYGRGNEGFGGYGHHRFERGPSENGDDLERFSEGNPLRRRYPSESRGF